MSQPRCSPATLHRRNSMVDEAIHEHAASLPAAGHANRSRRRLIKCAKDSGQHLGSLKRSPRTMMAQAIRAILLASATAATLTGRRPLRRTSQSRFVPCCRVYRITAMAPATSSHRKCRLPCFDILPSLSLPPVECCRGTNPIQAARLRPDENAVQSPTSATKAVATIGPMPGISSSRRLSSHDRCQA
jgi:hypothetical protein